VHGDRPTRTQCSFQFNPTGTKKFTSSCDIAKQSWQRASVSYDDIVAPAGTRCDQGGRDRGHDRVTPEDIAAAKAAADAKLAELRPRNPQIPRPSRQLQRPAKDLSDEKTANDTVLGANLGAALKAAGYPAKADHGQV